MSIKRYEVEYYGLPPTRTHVAFTEHENGPWCHYDDVVGLEAAQEDLEEIHQRILSLVSGIQRLIDEQDS